jgi:hypothetical protein
MFVTWDIQIILAEHLRRSGVLSHVLSRTHINSLSLSLSFSLSIYLSLSLSLGKKDPLVEWLNREWPQFVKCSIMGLWSESGGKKGNCWSCNDRTEALAQIALLP